MAGGNLISLARMLRVYQWIKNLIVFFPLFFSERLFSRELLIDSAVTFIIFCLLSSIGYIINDISDIENDRLHPVKSKRPIASRAISISIALSTATVLFILAALLCLKLNQLVIIALASYFVLNMAYSFFLKRFSLFDIFMIGIFFELRIIAGGLAADVPLSSWLVLLTFFLALFLATGKRRDDLIITVSDNRNLELRRSLANYNEYFLNSLIILLSAIIIVTYLLYTISDEMVSKFGPQYYTTVLFPVMGVIRYLQVIFVFKTSGDPVKTLYTDRMLQVFIAGWLASLFYFIYGR